jgi:integrase
MIKLTKRTVAGLLPRVKPYVAFDGEVKGFGCRVMPSGVKTFILEYRPGAGGRAVAKRRLTLGRYGSMTPDQGRRAALAALDTIRRGHDPQADKAGDRTAATVATLIDAFAAGHVSKLKHNSRKSCAVALGRLRAAYGGLKAAAVTRAHVASLHAGMASTPYAANRLLATVSTCFAFGLDNGLLPLGHINPASKIGHYRETKRERFLTGDELARLGAALQEAEPQFGPWACAAIRLLLLTGARLREILDARWSQLDTERGCIFLPDSKSGAKPLYLSGAALAVITGLPHMSGNPFIIPGRGAGPRADLKRPWSSICKAAGLEGLRLHDLRHSFASVGAGSGMGLPILGKLLGHSDAATTQRYAHLASDPMRRAADTIGELLDEAMNAGKP